MVEILDALARERGLANLQAMVADITAGLPLPSGVADACLISTVFHMPEVVGRIPAIVQEARRVLKPCGRLAIIECSGEEAFFVPTSDP
jgi:ubiquinone/menaquinone biosynthesis C-methylase UbiE